MKQSKTVIVKKAIQRGIGKCAWCGQRKKGYVSDEIEVYLNCLENNFDLEWMRKGFFATPQLYWATRHKNWTVEKRKTLALICDDCIKQLSK